MDGIVAYSSTGSYKRWEPFLRRWSCDYSNGFYAYDACLYFPPLRFRVYGTKCATSECSLCGRVLEHVGGVSRVRCSFSSKLRIQQKIYIVWGTVIYHDHSPGNRTKIGTLVSPELFGNLTSRSVIHSFFPPVHVQNMMDILRLC